MIKSNKIISVKKKYLKPFNYVQKINSGSFKNSIYKMSHIFNIYV